MSWLPLHHRANLYIVSNYGLSRRYYLYIYIIYTLTRILLLCGITYFIPREHLMYPRKVLLSNSFILVYCILILVDISESSMMYGAPVLRRIMCCSTVYVGGSQSFYTTLLVKKRMSL